jgi:hypothetical protein
VTWVKLDDHFADHPKILGLSDRAYRAYVDGLCYCARYLTDGKIGGAPLKRLTKPVVVTELTTAGLWEYNGDGVVVHDYLEYQPSSAAILSKRAADSERKKVGVAPEAKRPVPVTPRSESKSNSEQQRKPKKPDELWDALVEILKTQPATSSERGRWNAALKQLREAGATAEDIRARAKVYRATYPDAALTPTALSSNWGSLAPKRVMVPPCDQCGVGGGQHTADCPVVAPFNDSDIENVAVQIEAHR